MKPFKRITIKAIMCFLIFCAFSQNTSAQETTKSWLDPLHLETSFEAGSQHKQLMSFGMKMDLNYNLGKVFSIHAIGQADYFVPKNGMTADYNKAINIGGGVGFKLFPKLKDFNTFELRADVTTTVNSTDLKNTTYSAGIYWYGERCKRGISPVIGIGYKFRDYRNEGFSNYSGYYVSLGLRF